jgi:uncharacterized membrane protein
VISATRRNNEIASSDDGIASQGNVPKTAPVTKSCREVEVPAATLVQIALAAIFTQYLCKGPDRKGSRSNVMRTTLARLFFTLGLAVYAGLASATYVFTKVDVPGSTYTTLWGINDVGWAAGNAIIAGNSSGFVYLSGQWVPLPAPPAGISVGGLGINNSGVVVGGASAPPYSTEQGFILDLLTATYTKFFTQPGWLNTEARAISNLGLVTGYSYNPASLPTTGFIYDPSQPPAQQFTNIGPAEISQATGIDPSTIGLIIAQGANTTGQVVGSFNTTTATSSAFLRQPDGTISTFRINNRFTTARGINDNGLIVGNTFQPTLGNVAYVGDSSGFQLLGFPGAALTLAEGLNNLGQVSGFYQDVAGNTHGFIATPATLPTGTTANGAYVFNVDVVPNVEIFIDPNVALGYDYAIGDGNPMFATVRLPIGIGNSLYTLIAHGRSFGLAGGDLFDFRTHGFPNGVAQFRVADIEQSAGLDPADPTAFVTGVSFVAAGGFTGTMTPLCQTHSLPVQAKVPPGKSLSPCGG